MVRVAPVPSKKIAPSGAIYNYFGQTGILCNVVVSPMNIQKSSSTNNVTCCFKASQVV